MNKIGIMTKQMISYRFRKQARLLALAVLFLAPFLAWGQTDYSGIYYIASRDWNVNNTTTNFYLCPTENWAYYQSSSPYYYVYSEGCNTDMPFLTTYQCRNGEYNAENAVWIIEKHATRDYYYIKRAIDGKYLTYNRAMGDNSNAGRMRVHLEASPTDTDNALFEITYSSSTGIYEIITIKESSRKYLNVTGPSGGNGNINSLQGTDARADGPSGCKNVGGIIGLYTAGASDPNGKWYLEPATVAAPTITNNFNGTITITAASGATIYYTTNGTDPTTSSSVYSTPINLTDAITVIKAIAKGASDYFPSLVSTYEIPVCERPVITVSNTGMVNITCATPYASIYYTLDDTPATPSSPSSTQYNAPFPQGTATVIRAVAQRLGYLLSVEAEYRPAAWVHHSSEITNMGGRYNLADDFVSEASIGTESDPFTGTIDGQLNAISGLDHPLVAYANGATIKNVILDNVNINNGENVGAICGEALGACRIYNCGVLATGSTVETDEDGYTMITNCSSTISGSNYVGGLVGLLDGSSRVINCFSYANITGGSSVGGIVGYNNVATTANNLQTMVMNCMFYGDITGDASKAPIYNGTIITNDGDSDGVNSFNYFRSEASYVQDQDIDVYNCALAAETRFLQRFEFFRHLLNSNRTLAAWWATGDRDNKDEMLKWVMEPSQIGTTTPYLILKTPGEYPSVVNFTPSETLIDEDNEHRNEGRKLGTLTVHIQMGSGGALYGPPTGAVISMDNANSDTTLIITDKDPAHFNFNYGKVQLPYYNQVGTKNYNGNRVVTGWKITSITGGKPGSFNPTVGTAPNDAPNWNFADRRCTNKDLYSVSGRIFNQGAYWDVPEGVTAITIEPYWAKCVYLADAYLDVVYKDGTWSYSGHNYDDAMYTAFNVTTIGGGQHYINNNSYNINGENQKVYTTLANATTALSPSTGTVYDNAIVLVSNYHQYFSTMNGSVGNASHHYTVTSIDLDFDNEPDANFIIRFNGRTRFHPVRYDFLNLIGLGMAQKTDGGTGTYNFGIMQPLNWLEVTNTGLFRCTQFEYSPANRQKEPIILQGGVVEQWVTQQQNAGDKVKYFHVGGNVWFKEFHRGSHQDNTGKSTPHPPISVTGGDFNEFYLTGLYQPLAVTYDDNAECYINGGRFGVMAGAGMEGIGTSVGKGNITWLIDNADISEFYGGGINANKPVFGNINTTISNSHVDSLFCGGPKFGDMENGRTVTTTATNCTFKTYFGAGYGGNSYSRRPPYNQNNVINIEWNTWVNSEYTRVYNASYGGVETQINYQFIPHSSNVDNVARLWIEYVGFSLATTHTVSSTLTDCTVTGNFYGGGSLGKVDVSVTSILDGCKVKGNVFGAGFSVSLPPVEVMNLGGFRTEPHYDEQAGVFLNHVFPKTETYTWEHRDEVNSTQTAIDTATHILYTQEDLGTLGTVDGNVTLTLKGNTIVGDGTSDTGNVFGGGDQSAVTGNTLVEILEHTKVLGNIYGGGNMGEVGGNTKVVVNGQSNNNGQGTGSGNNPNND